MKYITCSQCTSVMTAEFTVTECWWWTHNLRYVYTALDKKICSHTFCGGFKFKLLHRWRTYNRVHRHTFTVKRCLHIRTCYTKTCGRSESVCTAAHCKLNTCRVKVVTKQFITYFKAVRVHSTARRYTDSPVPNHTVSILYCWLNTAVKHFKCIFFR